MILPIRPRALGRKRLSGRARSAVICTIFRAFRFMNILFSALAAADCTTLDTVLAHGEVIKLSVLMASSTRLAAD